MVEPSADHWTRAVERLETGAPSIWSDITRLADSFARQKLLRQHVEPATAARIAAWLEDLPRAKDKWPHLEQPFFDRRALEQSTRFEIARWRAQEFQVRLRGLGIAAGPWCDLGCGAGAELCGWIASTKDQPDRVLAFESDAERATLARRNLLRIVGGRRLAVEIETLELGASTDLSVLEGAAIVFSDPSRRDAGGRRSARSLQDASPNPTVLLRAARIVGERLALKAAPACEDLGVLAELAPERTHVSVGGEMKEQCLWCGPLRGRERSAVALPSAETVGAEQTPTAPVLRTSSESWREGDLLLAADVSVRRAQLLDALAERFSADIALGDCGILHRAAPLEHERSGRGHLLRAHRLEAFLPSDRRSAIRALRELGPKIAAVRQIGPCRPGSSIERSLRELSQGTRHGVDPEFVLLCTTVDQRPCLALTRALD